jgi:hypothetical protein
VFPVLIVAIHEPRDTQAEGTPPPTTIITTTEELSTNKEATIRR